MYATTPGQPLDRLLDAIADALKSISVTRETLLKLISDARIKPTSWRRLPLTRLSPIGPSRSKTSFALRAMMMMGKRLGALAP